MNEASKKQCRCCDEEWTTPSVTHEMCYKSFSPDKKTHKEAIDICENNELAVLGRPFSDEDHPFIRNLTGKQAFKV